MEQPSTKREDTINSIKKESSSSSEQEEYSDEGFKDEVSSDEESFFEKFMRSTHNQIAFSIPNIEEKGRLKNKIDPKLPDINKSYSLLPDMATGWRPKMLNEQIPSPIPLYFGDKNQSQIISRLSKQTKFPLIYLCSQPKTSFDLHRQFSGNEGAYNFRFAKILFDENILKQFRISFNDGNSFQTQMENMRLFSGMHPDFPSNSSQNLSTLQFDSFFEGGNLDAVVKISDIEYDLYLRPDTNTKGRQHYFYFKVSGMAQNSTVRFNICNMSESRSLYSRGLKPYVSSKKEQEQQGAQWKQEGEFVFYQKRKNLRYDLYIGSRRSYYQLTFDYTFQKSDDVVSFCSEIPYTYSQLRLFINSQQPNNDLILKEVKLCRSLGSLIVPLLNITDYSSQLEFPLSHRHTVIISARILPGHSFTSYIAENIIQQLLGDQPDIVEIRKKIIFRVVPMLNVDGSVAGNSNTSFSGFDLSKQINEASRDLTPEAYHLRRIVKKDNNNNKLLAYIDLRSNYSKKNCFISGPYFSKSELNFYRSRILPYCFSNRLSFFRYKSCRFTNQTLKKDAAHSTFHKSVGIFNSYALEISEGLKDSKQPKKGDPITEEDFKLLGREIALALVDFCHESKKLSWIKDNAESIKNKISEAEGKGQTLKFMPHIMRGKSIGKSFENNVSVMKNKQAEGENQEPQEKSMGELYLEQIKSTFKGIKENLAGKKKIENESDQFSQSASSEDDEYKGECRSQLELSIRDCLTSFKKQFIKTEQAQNQVVCIPKELVIVLAEPHQPDDKKSRKRIKKDLQKEEVKICKQFKSRYIFQEDYLVNQLLEDVIGRKDANSSKKNVNKAINQFIKKYYKEEMDGYPHQSANQEDSFKFKSIQSTQLPLSHQSQQQQHQQPSKQQQDKQEYSKYPIPQCIFNNPFDIKNEEQQRFKQTTPLKDINNNLNINTSSNNNSSNIFLNSNINNSNNKGRTPMKLSVISQKGFAGESDKKSLQKENENQLLSSETSYVNSTANRSAQLNKNQLAYLEESSTFIKYEDSVKEIDDNSKKVVSCFKISETRLSEKVSYGKNEENEDPLSFLSKENLNPFNRGDNNLLNNTIHNLPKRISHTANLKPQERSKRINSLTKDVMQAGGVLQALKDDQYFISNLNQSNNLSSSYKNSKVDILADNSTFEQKSKQLSSRRTTLNPLRQNSLQKRDLSQNQQQNKLRQSSVSSTLNYNEDQNEDPMKPYQAIKAKKNKLKSLFNSNQNQKNVKC